MTDGKSRAAGEPASDVGIGLIQDPEPPQPFRALLLAKAVFDPSGEGECAQVPIATDAKPWSAPSEGAIGIMVGKGGGFAVLIRYRFLISTNEGKAYWAFDRLEDSPASARVRLPKLLRAYRPPPKAPTIPGLAPPKPEPDPDPEPEDQQ